MLSRWAGPLVTALIVVGVALILFFNLNPRPSGRKSSTGSGSSVVIRDGSKMREYPIGDEVLKNHMRIAAVWLPPIQMDGMAGAPGSDVIHLEADVRATEGNPNGFALDEFVPYLKIAYQIVKAPGGEPIHEGTLMPMVAADGLHYGASVSMPQAGQYRLTYHIEPPSAGGLGRHSDPATGVAPWWEPFEVTFDWDYPGPNSKETR